MLILSNTVRQASGTLGLALSIFLGHGSCPARQAFRLQRKMVLRQFIFIAAEYPISNPALDGTPSSKECSISKGWRGNWGEVERMGSWEVVNRET